MKRNIHKTKLDVLEALLKPKGRMLVFSTPADTERIQANPADLVVITGVPRPAERVRP